MKSSPEGVFREILPPSLKLTGTTALPLGFLLTFGGKQLSHLCSLLILQRRQKGGRAGAMMPFKSTATGLPTATARVQLGVWHCAFCYPNSQNPCHDPRGEMNHYRHPAVEKSPGHKGLLEVILLKVTTSWD